MNDGPQETFKVVGSRPDDAEIAAVEGVSIERAREVLNLILMSGALQNCRIEPDAGLPPDK